MKYAYEDLGRQQAGGTAVIRLRGSVANVILLDAQNFLRYRAGAPFFYGAGGRYYRSPVELEVPYDGHWYVVIDLGGYRGRVRASVELVQREASPSEGKRVAAMSPEPLTAVGHLAASH